LDAVRSALQPLDASIVLYANASQFLSAAENRGAGCLVAEAGADCAAGVQLLHHLAAKGWRVPVVLLAGRSDAAMVVEAMHQGAFYVLESAVERTKLLAVVERALERSSVDRELLRRFARLTPSERQLLALLAKGVSLRDIARKIGVTPHTAGHRRDMIALTLQVRTQLELLRFAFELDSRWPDLLGDGAISLADTPGPSETELRARSVVRPHPEWEKIPLDE
jgi:FixJ family two-component response regulator